MPAGPNPAGFAQEVANNLLAALRGNASSPAVPDPVVKIVAQNQPLVAVPAVDADPVKQAVKDALLGDDRAGALTKALKACDGDYNVFTRYQQDLSREVMVEDAQELFGGFASMHNIQSGR